MFNIVCIVYNKLLSEIRSMEEFLLLQAAHGDVRICVYDNSVTEAAEQNLRLSKEKYGNIHYTGNGGNLGLSKAYNRMLTETGTGDWLLWTDDDTYFSSEYLENVYQETKTGLVPVISGVVKTQTGSVLSPVTAADHRALGSSAGKTVEDVYCINSGLCINREVYDRIGFYNEKLFLDMIDYWLFDEMRKRGIREVMIIPGEITQDFSGKGAAALKPMLRRFSIYRKDFRAYCELEGKSFFYREKILIRRYLNILRQGFDKRNR